MEAQDTAVRRSPEQRGQRIAVTRRESIERFAFLLGKMRSVWADAMLAEPSTHHVKIHFNRRFRFSW